MMPPIDTYMYIRQEIIITNDIGNITPSTILKTKLFGKSLTSFGEVKRGQ